MVASKAIYKCFSIFYYISNVKFEGYKFNSWGFNMAKEEFEKAFIEVPFALEVKELGEDSEFFQFEGYASTFGNIDKVDDIVVKGAFSKSIAALKANLAKLPVLWQHDRRTPLGVYFEFYEDDKGLFVKGRMPKADTFVSGRVIPQMKVGSVTKMSIGFWIMEREFNEEGIRLLKELDLFEVSLVTLPANDKAEVTGMKSLEEIEDLKGLEKFLKSHEISQKQAETVISLVCKFKKLDGDHQDEEELQAKEQGDLAGMKMFADELNKFSTKLTN